MLFRSALRTASEELRARVITLHLMTDGEYHVYGHLEEIDSASTKALESSPSSAQNAKVENDNASTRSPPISEAVIAEVQNDSSTAQRLASLTSESDTFPPATQTTALLPVSEADTSSSGTASILLLSLPGHALPPATEKTPLLAISQPPNAIDDQDQSSRWAVMCGCPCM